MYIIQFSLLKYFTMCISFNFRYWNTLQYVYHSIFVTEILYNVYINHFSLLNTFNFIPFSIGLNVLRIGILSLLKNDAPYTFNDANIANDVYDFVVGESSVRVYMSTSTYQLHFECVYKYFMIVTSTVGWHVNFC